jgi:hypothetical protein
MCNDADSFSVVQDNVGSFANSNYGGLVEDNTFVADANQGSGRAEVDTHIHTEQA